MKLILLDRDGVINHDSDAYIKSPDEWIPIPGSLEAIARLTQAGYRIAVLTNQSGVGRGYYSLATLAAMHEKMHQALLAVGGKIDAIFFCPHTPEAGCHCRKPGTGLFEQAAQHFQVDLQGVPMIGDSLRDIQAAEAMGCKAIRITPSFDLSAAVDSILT
jgi:D-glycero-D-manno-heptose 1,7-bisphosphate phosphatase